MGITIKKKAAPEDELIPLGATGIKETQGTGTISVKSPVVVKEDKVKFKLAYPEGTALANVGVGYAYTKNLGNYESAKVSIDIHMPCLPTPEAVDKMHKYCSAWVDGKIKEAMDEINEITG